MGEDQCTEMESKNEEDKSGNCFKINKNLIMLKFSLFLLYGATSSLLPYLTIHMQSIGITMEEISLIYLALPFTTFLAPPFTGYLVDKFGKYKPVVIVSFISTAVLHHSLLLIPHQEMPGGYPPGFVITHPTNLFVEVWWSPCPSRECPEQEELDIVLDLCVDHCLLKKKKANQINATALDVGSEDDLTFHLAKKNKNRHVKNITYTFTLDMHQNLGDPIEQFGIDVDSAEDDDVMELTKRFTPKLLRRFGVNVPELDERDLRCGGIVLAANISTKRRLKAYSDDCILQKCNFRTGGPEICPPDYKDSDDKIFWIYFFVRFLANIMMTAGVTIMDPIALSLIEKYGGDFGKEKLFSSLGMAIFSPMTGLLIDVCSGGRGYTDYSAAFYAHDVLLVVAAIAVCFMPLEDKLPADNIFKDLQNILRMPSLTIFIIFLYILGNFWGFIESYLFFYLRDLGASNFLLGITVTVGTLSSVPFLYGAEGITKKIGHINIIIIAFFAHALRLVGYSVIESAWWCFPFEALEAISVHLMWVAAATYCAVVAPKSLLATLIGILGMAHFSIGRGSGSFIGGHVISKVGVRQAFKIMGLSAVVSGFTYAFIHCIYLRNADIDEKDLEDSEDNKASLNDEPRFKDQGTMISYERLSLIIECNQIGSVSSLGKSRDFGLMGKSNSNLLRRGSYIVDTRNPESAYKVDLLRSTMEINTRNTSMKISNKNLSKPTLNNSINVIPETESHDEIQGIYSIPKETDEIIYETVKRQSNSISENQE